MYECMHMCIVVRTRTIGLSCVSLISVNTFGREREREREIYIYIYILISGWYLYVTSIF